MFLIYLHDRRFTEVKPLVLEVPGVGAKQIPKTDAGSSVARQGARQARLGSRLGLEVRGLGGQE